MTVDAAALAAGFQAHLDAIAVAHRDRPIEEFRALLLLALEREAIVTVAYRREIVEARLARSLLPADVRTIAARAVRWTWREEEMHACYVRALLLADAGLPARARAWLVQFEGQVAGWASASQHHHRWSEAPFVRGVAELVELAGVASGRIPDEARGELQFTSLSGFAAFSSAAERTAAMGFRRLAKVGPAERRADFEHLALDEERHAAIFDVLASAFDAHDGLVDGWSAERLGVALEDVGQRFVTIVAFDAAGGSVVRSPAQRNPLGKGATVAVSRSDDLAEALSEVIARTGLDALLAARRTESPLRVAVKASFAFAVDRRDPSPAVDPALVHALFDRLRARGAEPCLLEAPNLYDRFHGGRSVAAIASYLGLPAAVDTSQDLVQHAFLRGIGQEGPCRAWAEADLRIVVGKLRSHPVNGAMGCLDALEGLGGRHDRFLFADRGADRDTATMMVIDAFPPDWGLLDAFRAVPDGLLGMIACRDPLEPRRLYASTDAVALDAVALRHVGAAPERAFVGAAFDWFGDPRAATRVDGPDTGIAGWRAARRGEWTALLSALAEPVYVHASGHGAVFVPPMDASAFPPLHPPSRALTVARSFVRSLTGLAGPAEGLPTRHGVHRGRRVRVYDNGGTGTPVVLLHGYPDNLHLWARVARRLGTRRCLAVDWPGLGDSEGAAIGADPEALAGWLVDWLDGQGVDRAVLVGADMGAQPVLVAAALRPDRVESAVVLNHLAFVDGEQSFEIQWMRRSGLASVALRNAARVVYAQCLRTFLPEGGGVPRELDDELWRCFSRAPVRERLVAMCAAYEGALPRLPELYASVRCPVRVIWGCRDPHFPPSIAERLVSVLPRAHLTLLPEVGHWPQWTAAETVGAALEAS